MYAVSFEYYGKKICDADGYDLSAMSAEKIWELSVAGGVYVDEAELSVADTRKVHAEGKEIAFSVITNSGVELQWCNSAYPDIKKAMELHN